MSFRRYFLGWNSQGRTVSLLFVALGLTNNIYLMSHSDISRIALKVRSCTNNSYSQPPMLSLVLSANVAAPIAERLGFVPQGWKCPLFSSRSAIAVSEWIEEVQAGIQACHLSLTDQVYFVIYHFEGEAGEEIMHHLSIKRGWRYGVYCRICMIVLSPMSYFNKLFF